MTAPQTQGFNDQLIAGPRRPPADRRGSMRVARTELDRFLGQLGLLTTSDWSAPTDCAGWDVRDLSSHVLGMSQMFSSYRKNLFQHLPAARAVKRGEVYIDALTARQVSDRRALTPAQIVDRLSKTAPRMVRWRRRTPPFMRSMAMPDAQPVSSAPDAPTETWTFGYLFDTILTRDTWMHRMDIAKAVGQLPELTADHDGRIIADVVTEWQTRHSHPFDLTLTGPAGGAWRRGVLGSPTETITMDAVEFARALSGRAPAPGLLAVAVPF